MFTHFTGFDFTKADMNDHLEFEAIDSLTSLPFYYMKSVTKPVLPGQGNALFDLSTQLIDSTISAYMDYYQIEGVVFATLAKDRISYLATYGTKNSYTNQPIKASSLFEVASITKPFLAYAALRLYDKGLLDLDLPLSSYLPFQAISNSEYAQLITARQVLTHQTGLPNWPTGGRLDFKFEPGTGFEYSGSAYQYLGRVMESITGKSIDEIMKEEISVGLGIDHLYFKKSFYAYKNKVHGHFNGFPGVIDLPDQPWMAGSLVTNASALAKFIFAIHNRRGLKDETYEQIFSNYIEIPERYKENNWGYRESMGLGFFIEHAPYGRVFKHSGNNGDFKAVFRYYEDLDKGYILLTNGNTGHFIINAIEKI